MHTDSARTYAAASKGPLPAGIASWDLVNHSEHEYSRSAIGAVAAPEAFQVPPQTFPIAYNGCAIVCALVPLLSRTVCC